MKFLLAVGSKEYSGGTLHLGAQIAQTFEAGLGVVYVGEKSKEMFSTSVNLARDNLAQWNIQHPGVDVLEWAFTELKQICPEEGGLKQAAFNPENIVEEDGRYRMILPAGSECRIDLILREGEIIEELRSELLSGEYELAIIGGSQSSRKMAHDLIQFLPTSVLVVQSLDLQRQYTVLLLVDDSEAT